MKKRTGLLFLTLLFCSDLAFATCDAETVLMLHANGADTSTTFTDSSVSAKTVTAVGNAQIDTAQSKFGGASGLFDGTGDYLTAADSDDWNFGTGKFTIDMWIRVASAVTNGGLIGHSNTAAPSGDLSDAFTFRTDTSTSLEFVLTTGGVNRIVQGGSHAVAAGAWFHVALIRGWGGNADDWAITVNGSSIVTFTDADGFGNFTSTLRIGLDARGGAVFNGHIDELRVSKGIARWTVNFTPETSEYCASARRIISID